jgi:hypothetical protein
VLCAGVKGTTAHAAGTVLRIHQVVGLADDLDVSGALSLLEWLKASACRGRL